jgi:hypothetical protein
MKKYKLKITHSYLTALARWVEGRMMRADGSKTALSEAACWAVLNRWVESEKVRQGCKYPWVGEKKMSLSVDVALALAWLIASQKLKPADYLDNYLLQVYAEIHQLYATINTHTPWPNKTD